MFGAGNEPTTLEEFHRLIPFEYYAYNSGTETTIGAFRNDIGNTTSIVFPDNAGIVGGGILNVTTGELTVTHVIDDLGDSTWSKTTNASYGTFFYHTHTGKKAGATNFLCSELKVVQRSSWGEEDYLISGNSSTG